MKIIALLFFLLVPCAPAITRRIRLASTVQIPLQARGVSPDGKSASVQFLITGKMKKILKDDLGYFEEEIFAMEPEIAKIVISKQLKRPESGMPKSWRRGAPADSINRNIQSYISAFIGAPKKIMDALLSPGTRSILAYCMALGVCYAGASKMLSTYRAATFERKNTDAQDQVASLLNIKSMEKVQNAGIFDRLQTRLDSIKDKYL
jgi:hypothetical protein